MKFAYGKKQQVDTVDLDQLFTDLQAVLKKHPLVPAANIDVFVSEWINDILFVAGKITEDDLKEAMETFESVENSEKTAGATGGKEDESDEDEDDE